MTDGRSASNWDNYRFFLAVARRGTLAAAADALRTEPTTVGRRIRNLEAELATPVFHRNNQGYTLTDAGRKLLTIVESMESSVASAGNATAAGYRVTGRVRIGAPDGFATVFIMPSLGKLILEYPDLTVEVVGIPRFFSLSRREADIAVGLAPADNPRVVSTRLLDYTLGLYSTNVYLTSAPPINGIDDLPNHPIIGYVEELSFALSRTTCPN